jgi:hypothetical protein
MAKFFKGFLVAVVGSVVANLIILFLIGPMVINTLMPLHALSVGPVVGLTVMGAIGATIVYALMRTFMRGTTANPNGAFVWVAVVVLILSFIPDYLIIGQTSGPFAGGSWPSALTLALMHVVAAVIIVGSLTRLWGPKLTSSPSVQN